MPEFQGQTWNFKLEQKMVILQKIQIPNPLSTIEDGDSSKGSNYAKWLGMEKILQIKGIFSYFNGYSQEYSASSL